MSWINLSRALVCFIEQFVLKAIVIVIVMVSLILAVGIFDYVSFNYSGFVINPFDGWLFALISPPVDYFRNLDQMNLSDDKHEYVLRFSPKYAGRHALAIEFTPSLGIGVMAKTDMLDLNISLNGETPLSVKGETLNVQVWQSSSMLIDLWQFDVPKNVRRRQSCEVIVRFEKGLAEFLKRYPMARLVVQKESDE